MLFFVLLVYKWWRNEGNLVFVNRYVDIIYLFYHINPNYKSVRERIIYHFKEEIVIQNIKQPKVSWEDVILEKFSKCKF